MTMVDWIFLAIVLISTAIALVRGFVKEVISLVTWLAAFGIALAFSQTAAVLVPEAVDIPSARVAIAFVALFVVVLILGGIINWAISKLVETTGLSGTDRSVGMVFGLLRGVLIVAGLLLLGGFTALPQEAWWQASTLIPHFQVVAEWLLAVMPADVARNVQW
ncbi:CvpA family protein [Guyparkeria sp. SCN-R1]|uniref:CvpA family protein n=1 Tax=Guyparkeria sp. SCN-R1 TaxID=2341113 RepID=UPI000F64F8A9|nr:CvpA family protein [Guyparkeria sp. SCN-R1]RRQ23998.1 CvpA family protein [Guyparkeria sp. SCN-R1]